MKLGWMWLCCLLLSLLPASIQAQERVLIKWHVIAPDESRITQKVIADFNNSQDAIELQLVCVCGGTTADYMLGNMLLNGSALDIIGPVSVNWANGFTFNQWIDLQPLVDSHGYDLSQFPQNIVDTHRTPDGLSSLPFAAHPGALFYNADLFDAAGLNYPPTAPDTPYIMPDGSEVPWDYETVAAIGPLLTLDANGHNATQPDFDPDRIVQFGFIHQWDTLRSDFHTFGPADVVDEHGEVVLPDHWRAQARWLWEGVWVDHFIPTKAQASSDAFRTDDPNTVNPFASGHVAMTRTMSWYASCCLMDLDAHWDLAIQPAYEGRLYSPMDFDSFYIHNSTRNPDEAFIALQYLLGPAALELLEAYQGFPARPDLHEAALARYQAQYPEVQHWEVLLTSIPLSPVPHHESAYPNYSAGQYRFEQFLERLYSDDGANMDLEAELDRLEADLEEIVDAETESYRGS